MSLFGFVVNHASFFSIPGIDEATALASAISHIESGKYDLIVFDTAPTGHTLKLLALPEIIQVRIRNRFLQKYYLHNYDVM